jgi:hypothetical protein
MANFVITWRAPGGTLYFFRGDGRYEIFLPYISEATVQPGWVTGERFARVFTEFPVFTARSYAKGFNASRLKIYPYEKEVLPTQIVLPTKRPNQQRTPRGAD